jgi:hypothetical protein
VLSSAEVQVSKSGIRLVVCAKEARRDCGLKGEGLLIEMEASVFCSEDFIVMFDYSGVLEGEALSCDVAGCWRLKSEG